MLSNIDMKGSSRLKLPQWKNLTACTQLPQVRASTALWSVALLRSWYSESNKELWFRLTGWVQCANWGCHIAFMRLCVYGGDLYYFDDVCAHPNHRREEMFQQNLGKHALWMLWQYSYMDSKSVFQGIHDTGRHQRSMHRIWNPAESRPLHGALGSSTANIQGQLCHCQHQSQGPCWGIPKWETCADFFLARRLLAAALSHLAHCHSRTPLS